jgi:uncharacterized protein YkvS
MICGKKDSIEKKILSQKKINKIEKLNLVGEMLQFIDYVNSLPEYTEYIWDNKSLSDIYVLDEFKDFIMPETVRVDANSLRTPELLIRERDVKNPFNDYLSYITACDIIRGWFKKDAHTDITPITSLRRRVNLNDITEIISVNGLVKSSDKVFVAIPVIDLTNIYGVRTFTESADIVLDDYITAMRFV